MKDHRPLPPPPPPKSLITLLKKNASVYQYFTSLQQNLEYDVMYWKSKARHYKQQYEQLQQQNQQTHPNNNDDEKDNHPTSTKTTTTTSKNGIAVEESMIQDEMFHNELSSSSSLNDNDVKQQQQKQQQDEMPNIITIETTTNKKKNYKSEKKRKRFMKDDISTDDNESFNLQQEEDENHDTISIDQQTKDEIRNKLKQLYTQFIDMGIPLVTVTYPEVQQQQQQQNLPLLSSQQSISSSEDDDDGFFESFIFNEDKEDIIPKETLPPQKQSINIQRRMDEDVLYDIYNCIRMCLRLSQYTTKNQNSMDEPFLWTPTSTVTQQQELFVLQHVVMIPQHPASIIFQQLSNGFLFLQYIHRHWNHYLNDDDDDSPTTIIDEDDDEESLLWQQVKIGLQNRYQLIQSIISSLHGELLMILSSSQYIVEMTNHTHNAINLNNSSLLQYHHHHADDVQLLIDDYYTNHFHNNNNNKMKKMPLKVHLLAEQMFHIRFYVHSLIHHEKDIIQATTFLFDSILTSLHYIPITTTTSNAFTIFLPIISFCMLESIFLLSNDNNNNNDDETWFQHTILKQMMDTNPRAYTLFQSFFSYMIRQSAQIRTFHIQSYTDASTTTTTIINPHRQEYFHFMDVLELSSHQRLVRAFPWIQQRHTTPTMNMTMDGERKNIQQEIVSLVTSLMQSQSHQSDERHLDIFHIQLGMLLLGDLKFIQTICNQMLETTNSASNNQNRKGIILACLTVYCKILNYTWSNCIIEKSILQITIQEYQQMEEYLSTVSKKINSTTSMANEIHDEAFKIRCAIITCNPMMLLLPSKINDSCSTINVDEPIIYNSIRVINLKRRYDRWYHMLHQARRNHLCNQNTSILLWKAVQSNTVQDMYTSYKSILHNKAATASDKIFHGQYAFDGQDNKIFCSSLVETFVSTHWCPSDLASFDKHISNTSGGTNQKVAMSSTERACALSHISSWMGVHETLSHISILQPPTRMESFLYPSSGKTTMKLLEISGVACGPAIMKENQDMEPAPVCIIMEDDATLVDRFTDRLHDVLQELPRDFHFCSIGYGRPKSAPIVKYSKELGLPTFFWYLTGYILSQKGVEYLLRNSLPIVGPIDSHLGLFILHKNWDNIYGQRMGVGTNAAQKIVEMSSSLQQNLDQIIQVRAFATLTPLCSQKLGFSTSSTLDDATTSNNDRAKWRSRDTDIVFTGHSSQTIII